MWSRNWCSVERKRQYLQVPSQFSQNLCGLLVFHPASCFSPFLFAIYLLQLEPKPFGVFLQTPHELTLEWQFLPKPMDERRSP